MGTAAGYTIGRNRQTGYYEYLTTDDEGRFRFSDVRVGIGDPRKAGIPKRVRESGDIIRERRRIYLNRMAVATAPQIAMPAATTTGDLKLLVILANFSDTTTTYTQSDFNSLFNTPGYSDYGALGSVWDYFDEASYGLLNLDTTVSVWVDLPHTMAYYGANISGYDVRPREMVEDAIAALDATGFDFSPFDVDEDGWIDAFAVIHQGRGEEAGGGADTIWSHKWALSSPVTVDGINIQTYYTGPEKLYSSISTIGVHCHEFGHVLGLPDLYDYGYDSKGVGDWGIMAGGSWNNLGRTPAHFLGWCKAQLAWVVPTQLDADQSDITVSRLSDNQSVYRISDGMGSGEYLMVENRQLHGFDSFLPGAGILITHIDENQPNNNDQTQYLVGIVQADGLWHLENNVNYGDTGDPYPGSADNRALSPWTDPDSDSYYNGVTGIAVFNISDSAATMTFDLDLQAEPKGSLTVNIEPAEAVVAGAQWRRVGTSTWYDSGFTESEIPVGDYDVEFSSIAGWITPSNEPVTITVGETTTTSGTYTLQTGSLRVTIEPQGAKDAGAQWRRIGTSTWYDSDFTESGIPTGSYNVEFKSISGWDTPSNEPVVITFGGTATASGTYILQTGSLSVTIEPQGARDAGAQWRRVGTSIWHDSGYTESDIPVGEETVEFQEIEDWAAPENQPVTIIKDDNTPLTGTYVICPKTYDVNLDGSVTPGDALMAFQHYLGIITISDPCSLLRADANDDGSITPGDALIIFQDYLGLN